VHIYTHTGTHLFPQPFDVIFPKEPPTFSIPGALARAGGVHVQPVEWRHQLPIVYTKDPIPLRHMRRRIHVSYEEEDTKQDPIPLCAYIRRI
jgi:hypothetical protein